jgi:Leucyl aminopeptidase
LPKPLLKLSKKFKQISVDLTQLPQELHYLFALALTQASYGYDEYKSKKNEFILQQIDFIAAETPLTAEQLQLIQAVQTGQNLARDLGNRPGNICSRISGRTGASAGGSISGPA